MIKGIFRLIFKSPIVVGERYISEHERALDPFRKNSSFWRCTVKEVKEGYVQYERDSDGMFKIDSCDIEAFRICWRHE